MLRGDGDTEEDTEGWWLKAWSRLQEAKGKDWALDLKKKKRNSHELVDTALTKHFCCDGVYILKLSSNFAPFLSRRVLAAVWQHIKMSHNPERAVLRACFCDNIHGSSLACC